MTLTEVINPSPHTEEEEKLEQGRGDLESTPFQVKQNREQEKDRPRKKIKATKSLLDLITLTEDDLDNIGTR